MRRQTNLTFIDASIVPLAALQRPKSSSNAATVPAGRLHAPGRRITGAGQRSLMTPERNDSGTATDAQDALHNEGGIRLAVKAISAFTIQPYRRDEFVRLFESLVATTV